MHDYQTFYTVLGGLKLIVYLESRFIILKLTQLGMFSSSSTWLSFST
ncbi:MAG: hypothetical protein NZ954_01605 [Thermofilaceae archaeon]|nr:hypothetical protein [Thermofilaceae archaeon]MCX8180433.1 hypothetical protein [Thermofilaceae archaeon]MDW8003370.1 hypothetical protein [Thermofilaceae archaeon]